MKRSIRVIYSVLMLSAMASCATTGDGCYDFGSADENHSQELSPKSDPSITFLDIHIKDCD